MRFPEWLIPKEGIFIMLFDADRKIALDRSSPVPLYYQIYRIITDYMKEPGTVGRKLPTEEAMMKVFNVSRATVRRALQSLESSGQIARMRGKGTVVTNNATMEHLTTIRSFTDQMRLENHVPITQVVEVSTFSPDEELAKRLQIPQNEDVLRVTRLRGNELYFPLVLFISFLPLRSGLTVEDNYEGSLYELLRNKGVPVIDGDALIEAKLAEGEIAKLLKIEVGSPVLYYERLGSTFNGEPIELVQCWYEAGHYKFRINLTTGY